MYGEFDPGDGLNEMTDADRKWLRNVGLAIFAVIILVFTAICFSGPVLSQEVKACTTIEMALADIDKANKMPPVNLQYTTEVINGTAEVTRVTKRITENIANVPDNFAPDAYLKATLKDGDTVLEITLGVFQGGCLKGVLKTDPAFWATEGKA